MGQAKALSSGAHRSCRDTRLFKLLFQHFAAYKGTDCRCNNSGGKHGNQDAGSPADFAQKLDALQLPGRKLLPLYPLAKPLFRLLRTGMVRDLQRTLRRLGLGRYVDARAAAELADRPILPYLEWILLQFMDGSAHPVGRDSAVYRLVLSVIEIPAHLLPGNMDMKKLIFACDAILTGGDGDHQQSIL